MFLVDGIHGRRDRTHVASVEACDETLDFGHLEIGILSRIEKSFSLEEQRRNPMRVVLIDGKPGLDEASDVPRRERRLCDLKTVVQLPRSVWQLIAIIGHSRLLATHGFFPEQASE